MKKIGLFALILLTVVLTGCFGGKKENKELKIKLYENGSTGYMWYYEVSDPDIIEIKSMYETNCPEDVSGCGGDRIYTIKGLKAGKVTLTLDYSFRYGDEVRETEKTVVYEITIDEDLNIEETHTEKEN